MIGTAIVFWPAAPLFLFMHGKDITIPQGHEVTVYTDADYALKATSATAKNSAVTGSSLSNSDILTLKQAGLSEQLLIAKIKATPGNYHLDTEDMISLKKAGVSDAVMAAMMEAQH